MNLYDFEKLIHYVNHNYDSSHINEIFNAL